MSSALRDHPDICFAVPKEPHYFSRLPESWSSRKLGEDYLPVFFKHWQDPDAMLGEGSPSYIYSDHAIETIEREFPGARYIVMVRNPMQMLPSYHQRLVYLLDENETDLVKAWRLQEERAQGRLMPPRCRNPYLIRYREICNLAERIDYLHARIGKDRIKLVLFDDFSSAPVRIYREVLEFLGLPDDGRERLPKRNRTRVPRRVMLHLLLVQPRSEVMRLVLARLRNISRKSPLIKKLMTAVRRRSSTVTERPGIPPELWDECIETFRPNVERLSVLFDRDLSHWLDSPPPRRQPPADLHPHAAAMTASDG